jgi:hypothetical protein
MVMRLWRLSVIGSRQLDAAISALQDLHIASVDAHSAELDPSFKEHFRRALTGGCVLYPLFWPEIMLMQRLASILWCPGKGNRPLYRHLLPRRLCQYAMGGAPSIFN